MPDWNHIVRGNLAVLRLPPEREIEIVEELGLTAFVVMLLFGLTHLTLLATHTHARIFARLARARASLPARDTRSRNLRAAQL